VTKHRRVVNELCRPYQCLYKTRDIFCRLSAVMIGRWNRTGWVIVQKCTGSASYTNRCSDRCSHVTDPVTWDTCSLWRHSVAFFLSSAFFNSTLTRIEGPSRIATVYHSQQCAECRLTNIAKFSTIRIICILFLADC